MSELDDSSLTADGAAAAPVSSPVAATSSGSGSVEPALLSALQQHIVATVPALVQGNATVLQQYAGTKEAETIFSIFLADPLTFTLLVHKRVQKSSAPAAGGEEAAASESALDSYSFDLQHKPPSANDKEKVAATVAFIKQAPTLDLATAPLAAQLLTVSVNESHLFESMLAYVRHVFLPYSRAWMSGAGGASNREDEHQRTDAETAVYRGVNRKLGSWRLSCCASVILSTSR